MLPNVVDQDQPARRVAKPLFQSRRSRRDEVSTRNYPKYRDRDPSFKPSRQPCLFLRADNSSVIARNASCRRNLRECFFMTSVVSERPRPPRDPPMPSLIRPTLFAMEHPLITDA